jgi:ABC-type multidrug transport system fused ATPase/permease subunit
MVNKEIATFLDTYRETHVLNRQMNSKEKINQLRISSSRFLAEQVLLPNISKYLLEIVIILGALLIAGFQFYYQNAVQAVSSLTIFVAASTRIIPSLLRIQQSLSQINASIGGSTETLDLLVQLKLQRNLTKYKKIEIKDIDFEPNVSFVDVSFNYLSQNKKVLKDVTFEIKAGEFIAFVGPSGAGKSTLVDLLLGLNMPTQGKVCISGVEPGLAIANWGGEIGYVPQKVNLVEGTIFENIALGIELEDIDQERVLEVARIVDLDYLLDTDTTTPDEYPERSKIELSGGQRQRIGIARALYSDPKLLILDESTSALDSKLESKITAKLQSFRGEKTIIIIAHRLSSVVTADRLFYFEDGELLAHGSFNQLKEKIPNFKHQAELMGL